YDNALLVDALSEAYQVTHDEKYKTTIEHTLSFIERELLDAGNGFYAALDADSEGEEGKYYVWQLEEVKALLGDDAAIYCDYYNISAEGNWLEGNDSEKGRNIL